MTQNVGRLGVILGIDTAEFVRGLEQAKRSITDFAMTNMPRLAAAGAAAFGAMTYKALQFADQMADVAKANDVAIATVLQLGQALTVSGGRASDAGKLFAAFSAQIDSAAQGSKQAQASFQRIGVTLEDLANLSTEDLFDKVIQSLAKMDDAISRNALAAQFFGRAMKGVDIREVAAQTKEGRDEFVKYAAAVQEAAEFQDKLDTALNKITLSFTRNVMPTFTRLAEELGKAGGVMESVFKGVDYFISHTAFGIRFLAGVIETTFEALRSISLYLGDLMTLNFNTAEKRLNEYLEKSQRIQNEVKAFGEKLFAPPAPPKAAQIGGGGRPIVDTDAEAVKKAEEVSAAFARQQSIKLEQLFQQREFIELTQKERQIAEAIAAIELDRKRQILDIEKRISEERAKGSSQKVIDALEEQKAAVNSLADAYKMLTEEEMKSQQEIQNTFEFGWNKAFKQYSEDAQNYARLGEQAFNTVISNMDMALTQFVTTGKLNFKQFAASVILDLIKIQMRMQMMQMFSYGKSLFSGFSFFGTQSPAPIFSAFPGAADGGYVDGPTVVGEQGPELFIPNRSGTVIPNQQMSSVMGSKPQVVYNGPYIENLQTIDAKSFEQRIMQSPNAVWAANKYADKSLQVGRGRT